MQLFPYGGPVWPADSSKLQRIEFVQPLQAATYCPPAQRNGAPQVAMLTRAVTESHDIARQRITLCLLAFSAAGGNDPGACEAMHGASPSALAWAVDVMQAHSDCAVVRFWACALLAGTSKSLLHILLPTRKE